MKQSHRLLVGTLATACVALLPAVTLGNVYPAEVSIDLNGLNTEMCGTLKVSYVLNEDATGTDTLPGVKIEVIDKSAQVVRTVTIASQQKGKYIWHWDGRKDDGTRADDDVDYTVKITAAALGYTAWTQISDENTPNLDTHFERPQGVGVNTDPTSPKYGRIYVAQASNLPTNGGVDPTRPQTDGIYMLRADAVDMGVFQGGLTWDWDGTNYSSPLRMTVGPDGHVYVADYANDRVYEFSDDLSTATLVIGDANRTTGQYIRSIYVTGTQAEGNRMIYAVNSNYNDVNRKGIIRYNLGSAAVASDTGEQFIPRSYFTYYPWDFEGDANGDWYVMQYRASPNQAPPISKFLDSTTLPLSTPAWEVSRTYTYSRGLGGHSPKGWIAYGREQNGTVYFFNMDDGAFLFDVVVGRNASGTASGTVQDIAFDAVGNLYTVDNTRERLRVWSPPDGPNSSSTTTAKFELDKPGDDGPEITQQPDAMVVACPNGSASLSVIAGGDTGLTYQWQKNGEDLVDGAGISGAQTANLSLTSIPASDADSVLTVVVCGDSGVIISQPTVLKIGLQIVGQPATRSVCVGVNVTYNVMASGVGTITYKWQKYNTTLATWDDLADGGNISGTDTPALTISGVGTGDNNLQFRCALWDDCNVGGDPVTTNAAGLFVSSGPVLQHVGYGGSVDLGANFGPMTCYATGTGILHFQWKRNGQPIEGATESSYRIVGATCADGGNYCCEVTDDCGTAERCTDITGATTVVTVVGIPEVCNNEVDDDCDGLIDCDDPDCEGDPNCRRCFDPFADADGDEDVDMYDFGAWQLCYTGPGDPEAVFDADKCWCFDRDDDSDVDAVDFLAFEACFSGGDVPADPACDD